jgi:small-conductance mechanosensitive channel
MNDWVSTVVLGNSLAAWAASAAAAAVVLLVLLLGKRVLAGRLKALAGRTAGTLDDIAAELIVATRGWVLLLLALYIGSTLVSLADAVDRAAWALLVLALAAQVLTWGNLLIAYWLVTRFRVGEQVGGEDAAGQQLQLERGSAFGAVGFVARLALWSVVGLLVMDNLGIDVTTLLAGVGVGGIAVALATQSVLGDIFNSLSIVLDKPFEVGDYVVVGDIRGNVERIGIKTTRLRSLTGEQIIFANSDLVGSRIQNFKSLKERRALFQFGVTYQTPAAKLEEIPAMVKRIIEGVGLTRVDRVHFASYGDSALLFEVVYYVLSREYVDFMDVQHEINLSLFRTFEGEGIEFAYPTQTLYLQQADA